MLATGLQFNVRLAQGQGSISSLHEFLIPWIYYSASMREPIGRIHWAGTETSEKWMGYVDGAIRSGERAAAEVLEVDKENPHRVLVRR